VTWPAFPKRLQSALKALCCLAQAGTDMQSQEIAKHIDVPNAETSKILQFLVWGGFITSRRGSKGGFQLASAADQITMGEVINFFLTRHPIEPEKRSPVMRALRDCMAPCQRKFAKLSLAQLKQRAENKFPKKRPVTGGSRKSGRASGGYKGIAL
jgi:Rrf2 family protein